MQEHISQEQVVIIGAGPCGLAAAIAVRHCGMDPLLIEKGNIVQTIYRFPTHQTFFSSAELLEIGDIPFIIEQRKPNRNQALAYYREVVSKHSLRIHSFEEVKRVETRPLREAHSARGEQPSGHSARQSFLVHTETQSGQSRLYACPFLIIATGYYDHPNMMNIPGEHLGKVYHYFKEAHPFYDQNVVVIGGKNSMVDTALELEKARAHVTVLYRGTEYSASIKPWILPEFLSLVRQGKIRMEFGAEVTEITANEVIYRVASNASAGQVENITKKVKNDFVFAMTGYRPDHHFLEQIGVGVDHESGRPVHNPQTMETNIENLFIAGVIAAGNEANEIFIENGRFHGNKIAAEIKRRYQRDNLGQCWADIQ